MDKAREVTLSKDTMMNAVKRGAGELDGVNYERSAMRLRPPALR